MKDFNKLEISGDKKNTWAFVLIILLNLISIQASALDYPHFGINNIGCDSCHFIYGTEPSLLPPWTAHTPQNIDDTQYNTLCWSCHNDIDAPYVRTHSSLQIDNSYGDWTVECKVCHNPHYQKQKEFGSASYLYSGTSTNVTSTTLIKSGAGWTTDAYKDMVVIPNVSQNKYIYKITGNTNDTLTIEGPIDLTKVSPGNTFAILYGQLVYNTIDLSKITITPAKSGSKTVRFFRPTGANSFADGNSTYDGVCEVCHTQTTHFRNDGTGSNQLHTNVGSPAGTNCIECHSHVNGFKHGVGVGTGCGDSLSCHGLQKSHPTHVGGMGRQLSLACSDCHNTSSFPQFKDGQNLANTTACNPCHSPGGSYDGVNDAAVGAKNNFTNGVYETNGSLKAGKEKWCASCHDESPSQIQNINAPNVVGDEDGLYTYGTGWGFYKTGHGLPSSQKYPASGGVTAGAGKECLDCHDSTLAHIDGNARTFDCGNGCDSTEYRLSYRLKLIGGQAPMQIPPTGANDSNQFRLCYSCHDSGPFTTAGNMNTNLVDHGTNYHEYHLIMNAQYPADYNYISGPKNSRPTCVICHNVHGSTRLAMVNDGKLINREPGLRMWYRNDDIVQWTSVPNNPPNPENLPLSASKGLLLFWSSTMNLCDQCHSSANLDGTLRSPYQNVQQIPTLTWTGQTGYEADGVNPDSAPGGSSFRFRVKYTDLNNDVPMLYQVWIDLNNDSDYDDPGEQQYMSPLNREDTNYLDGKIYTYATTLSAVGSLNYIFKFADALANATGVPASPHQVIVTNHAPTLSWTGEMNYETDGVSPDSGTQGGHFIFRVKYVDIDNNPPSEIKVWFDGSATTMTGVDAGDTDYTNGKLYYADIVLPSAGNYNYSFSAKDSNSANASGDPTSNKSITVTTGANAPTLSWTGETGYTADGVEPDSGPRGGHFMFRVKYTDADNNPPSEIKVWFDGSATSMTEVDTNDMDYANGKLYFTDMVLSSAGNYNYSFSAKDSTSSDAVGDPVGNKTVNVSNSLTVCASGANYTSIQAAINAASNGNYIVVCDGTYSEKINFSGKAIIVQSVNGAASTKIQGDNTNNPVVTFSSSETSSAVLEGFTIDNQYGTESTLNRGIYISGSAAPTIKDCIIQGNKIGANGAGIYINNGSATIENTTIGGDSANRNTCDYGCGIYATTLSAPLSINNSTISWNSSAGTSAGGGIYLADTTKTTTISNTKFSNNSTQKGGAIYSTNSPVTIDNSAFSNNTVSLNGGALYLDNASTTVTITGTTFNNNHSDGHGGAIYASSAGALSIDNSIFNSNSGSSNGGGMSLNNMNGATTISHSSISNNTASGHGAGIYFTATAASSLSLSNCSVNNNTAQNWNGGGLSLSGGSLSATISDSTFNGNSALNGHGGGIYAGGGTVTVNNTTVNSNNGGGNGGGVYFSGTTLTISKGVVSGNKTTTNGGSGGLYIGSGSATVTNSFITGNDGEGNNGGGIWNNGATLNVINSTIAGNYASRSGGGLYGSGTIKNSIIWGNTNISGWAGPQINGSTTVTYSDIGQDGYAGSNGNINSDPLFVDFLQADIDAPIAGGDFHIMPDSPAKNVANNSDAPADDVDGQTRPRIAGDPADMGADEYVSLEAEAPVVTAFTATSLSNSLVIPITSFTAADNVGVTGYQITASATPPSITGGGWSAVAPTTYIVDSDGTYTLYPWARDAAGNVSVLFGTPVTVVVNTGGPTVSSTTPANNATNVARNSAVTINWNESIDCTTANILTITISPAVGWTKTSCSGSQVVFTSGGQIGSTTYTVTVSSLVKDIAGNQMASQYQFSYTTVAPTVAAPTIGTPSALSTTSIRWNFTDHANNEDGFKIHDASNTVKASSATPDLSYLDETELTANTQYTRHVHAYKTDEESLPSSDASRYTLPLAPNVTADKTTSTWYTTSDVVFTNAAGFGNGAVQYYRYAWDTSATHTFTDSETQWSAGTLTKTATSEAGWYLHIKSYNGDNVANATTADYGPYNYDMTVLAVSTTVPSNGTSSVVLDSNVTINFNENVDCTTVTTSTVTINPSVGWTRSSCSGSQAVFTPNGQSGSTQYTVTVSTSVKDANSIPLSSSYQFSYTTVAAGGVITVCASGCDFTTIQGAVNDAGTTNGKVVRVSNGTYSENINFNGKLITIQSVNGAANTKIQGATSSTNSPVVTFSAGETSSAVLDGFTIDNQASDTATRGIYISGASPTVKNSIIEGNSCYGAEGGAGVYIYNSVPTFDTCTIRANSATNNKNGGGMSIKGAAGGATITNSTIGSSGNPNTATNYGGGIYFEGPTTGTLSISGSTISYNSANAGSGIYLTGVSTTTTITNTSVSNNAAIWTPGGGGIYSDNSALSLTNCNINNNTSLGSTNIIGGGIYLNGTSASATISGGTINGNQSGGIGGGIYITGSTAATPLSISNATISGNTAADSGGGIYLTGITNTVTISGTTISGNTGQWTGGGGIYNNAVTLTITDSHIDSNTLTASLLNGGGGGLYLTGAKTTTITNTTVNGNTIYGKGGGIYDAGGATLVFTGGSINSNMSSAGDGGGVNVDGTSKLTISKANIRGNNTDEYGGGIYYASSSATAASITNCTITGNLAKGAWGDGGGIYTSSGTFNLTNSTVAGNYALRNGGGMIRTAGTVNVKNSILWGNTAGNSGPQIYGTPTVTYSDIEGAFTGTGNINSDPSFVSFITPDDRATSTTPKTTGNFHIQSGSPVIDLGTATGAPSVDIDGESRPQPLGGAYDMGSDEFVIIPLGSPALDWTGEANFTTDGVNPDSARTGSNFEFRIKYTDAENNPPSSIQVWIDQDNDGSYASGEKYDMTGVDPGDTTYTDGKLYSRTLTLTNAGASNLNLNYRFYASDGTNDAVGAPTANQVVTVTPALQVPSGYPTIQAAINAASNGETISVSDGTYSENIDYGDKNITIISVNGAAVTTIQGAATGTNLPVVTFNSVPLTNSAVLDGFTINNQATANTLSRGIYIAGGAAPTIQNCIITGNATSTTDGAGIYITDAAATSVKLKNSTVSNNSARGKTGIWVVNSNLDITDTTIEINTATGTSSDGAGVYMESGTVNIDRSKIRGNSSARNGGGIYVNADTATIKNSDITGNVAATDGGGVRVNGGTLNIYNSTVAGNYAGATGGGGARVQTGTLNITNSIIYGNTSSGGAGILRSSGTVSINYSSYQAISGACTSCANNRGVGEDPLFVNLQQAGVGAPTTAGNFHLCGGIGMPSGCSAASPVINQGIDNGYTPDIDGEARPQGAYDMGSDEYVP
jgi:hypothetical protein